MKLKSLLIVLIFTLSQTTWANCPEDVQVLNKGQVANCDGLLFSPDASQKVDETQQDAEYYKQLSDQLYKRRDLSIKETDNLDKRLKLYMDQSTLLAQQLHKKEKEDKWQKIIYFGLGVFATGVAVYGASQLAR